MHIVTESAGHELALQIGLLSASPAAADTFTPTRFDDPAPANPRLPRTTAVIRAPSSARAREPSTSRTECQSPRSLEKPVQRR